MTVATPIAWDKGKGEGAHRGAALAKLRILKQRMKLGGLNVATETFDLGGGIKCVCKISYSQEEVTVILPTGAKEEATLPEGFGFDLNYGPITWDYQFGYGQEGTVGKLNLLSSELLPPAKPDLFFGEYYDWKGDNEDILTIVGNIRYMPIGFGFLSNYVYKSGKIFYENDNPIVGCAIHNATGKLVIAEVRLGATDPSTGDPVVDLRFKECALGTIGGGTPLTWVMVGGIVDGWKLNYSQNYNVPQIYFSGNGAKCVYTNYRMGIPPSITGTLGQSLEFAIDPSAQTVTYTTMHGGAISAPEDYMVIEAVFAADYVNNLYVDATVRVNYASNPPNAESDWTDNSCYFYLNGQALVDTYSFNHKTETSGGDAGGTVGDTSWSQLVEDIQHEYVTFLQFDLRNNTYVYFKNKWIYTETTYNTYEWQWIIASPSNYYGWVTISSTLTTVPAVLTQRKSAEWGLIEHRIDEPTATGFSPGGGFLLPSGIPLYVLGDAWSYIGFPYMGYWGVERAQYPDGNNVLSIMIDLTHVQIIHTTTTGSRQGVPIVTLQVPPFYDDVNAAQRSLPFLRGLTIV